MINPCRTRRRWSLALGLALTSAVATAQTTSSTGPFVNVNGKYVLYTYPAAPYAKGGVAYVPLVSFAELLGIRVIQSARYRTTTLLLDGRSTVFKRAGNGLLTAAAGHISVPIEMHGGELAVALPPLLDALKISYRVEATGLRVTDQRFLNPTIPPGQRFNYANGLPNRYKDWDYYFVDQTFSESANFIPMRFSLIRTGKIVTVQALFKLRQPKSPSRGVSMLVHDSNNGGVVKGDGLKPPPEPPPRPRSDFCQYTADTVLCKTSITFSKGGHVDTVLIHAFER